MKKHTIIIVFLLFVFVGCDLENTDTVELQENENLSDSLPHALAEEQGFDASELDHAIVKAAGLSNIQSILVARNGYIVEEKYFGDITATDLIHVRSFTKSVISALIGIAIDQGFIENIDQPISAYLSKVAPDLDEVKGNITIKQLLTMSSGLQWDEQQGNEYNDWFNSKDYINYVLEKPIVNEPGTVFTYNSGAAHLLSVILTETTGMETLQFADEYLFKPLGITERYWYKYGEYYNGGASLMLRTRDMAKIGFLYIQNGKSDNNQIVPSSWVNQSLEPNTLANLGWTWGNWLCGSYGFLWWLDIGQDFNVFMAVGYGGQIIYCVPDYHLVVATTSVYNVNGAAASAQEKQIIDLIVEDIIPSITII